jgi:hypothetical protein
MKRLCRHFLSAPSVLSPSFYHGLPWAALRRFAKILARSLFVQPGRLLLVSKGRSSTRAHAGRFKQSRCDSARSLTRLVRAPSFGMTQLLA